MVIVTESIRPAAADATPSSPTMAPVAASTTRSTKRYELVQRDHLRRAPQGFGEGPRVFQIAAAEGHKRRSGYKPPVQLLGHLPPDGAATDDADPLLTRHDPILDWPLWGVKRTVDCLRRKGFATLRLPGGG